MNRTRGRGRELEKEVEREPENNENGNEKRKKKWRKREKNETEAIDFDWKTAKTRFKREINNQRNQNFYFPRTQVERKLSLDRKIQKRKDIF